MELSINVGYFGPHISDDHDLLKKIGILVAMIDQILQKYFMEL